MKAALIVQGDALHLPLPDASVDLIVTSPPYFALRAYSAGPGEIGSEPTPQAYLEALWAATAEMIRVLKPTGSIFVNLGDKYSGAQRRTSSARPGNCGQAEPTARRCGQQTDLRRTGIPAKSLMLLPERYRVGCVDRLGLIARAVIVWDKPNGLPESVTDRVRRSHEDWVHLTKGPRYYSATDEIREPHTTVVTPSGAVPYRRGDEPVNADRAKSKSDANRYTDTGLTGDIKSPPNPLGKLPGSVWQIPSEPLRLPDHLGVQHSPVPPNALTAHPRFSPPGSAWSAGPGAFPWSNGRTVALGAIGKQIRATGWLARAFVCGHATAQIGTAQDTILGYAVRVPHTPTTPAAASPAGCARRAGRRLRPLPERLAKAGNHPLAARAASATVRRSARGGSSTWTAGPHPQPAPPSILDPFAGTGTAAMVATRPRPHRRRHRPEPPPTAAPPAGGSATTAPRRSAGRTSIGKASLL